MEMDETVLPPRPSIKIDLKAIRARLDNPQFYLRSTYLADVRALIAEVERLRGIEKDHLDDWRRIQDAERERDSLKKTHTPEKPREWWVIDDWSDPSQLILAVNRYDCFSEDPCYAGITPIHVIEKSYADSLAEKLEDQINLVNEVSGERAAIKLQLAEAKAEIERLKDTPGGKRIYGALNELEKEREKNRRLREALKKISEMECPYGEGGCDSDDKRQVCWDAMKEVVG